MTNKKKHKTYFNWSTGKDSAFALHEILKDPSYSIDLLLSSVNSHFDRVSMHGLRRTLLEAQASALGLPLETIELPENPSMDDYGNIMSQTVNRLLERNFTHCVFGDIFLEDLRSYRDQQLKPLGIEPVYPLWKKDTKKLIHEFIDLGFRAVVVSANSRYFNNRFVGSELTHKLIENLPEEVDPCGENGEFHTFCFDGPIFTKPVHFQLGERVYREYPNPHKDAGSKSIGYWYCDLLPVD